MHQSTSRIRCGPIHKQCMACGSCKRQLDASNFYDAGIDIFCKGCYAENFGVRGRAANRANNNHNSDQVIMAPEGDLSRCPRCYGKVFEAEQMKTSVGPFHPACFLCKKCSANLDVGKCNCGSDGEVYCSLCYKEEFGVLSRRGRSRSRTGARSRPASYVGPQGQDGATDEDALARAIVDTTSIMAESGDPSCCPKCKGKVFEAEKMASNNGVFHKKCFTCGDCKRALDPALVTDGIVPGEIFCRYTDKHNFNHFVKSTTNNCDFFLLQKLLLQALRSHLSLIHI